MNANIKQENIVVYRVPLSLEAQSHEIIVDLVVVRIRRKGPKRGEHVGMQKVANFTIVSTMVLIGLNIKFYEILAKQHVY